ncbi:MAG TPA: hypothetical protein VJV22_17340 [Acidobacteriaceae bacterium]|nr:hypothetical protein [Acidobacteriaceae bacterium]
MTRFTSLFAKSLFAVLIAAGSFATSAQAQNDAITVSVPFPFAVASQTIAPGTYHFSLDSSDLGSSGFLLSITNVRSGVTEMVEVLPEQQHAIEERGRLTFRKSAGRPVLTAVHFSGTNMFSQVIQRHRAGSTETP